MNSRSNLLLALLALPPLPFLSLPSLRVPIPTYCSSLTTPQTHVNVFLTPPSFCSTAPVLLWTHTLDKKTKDKKTKNANTDGVVIDDILKFILLSLLICRLPSASTCSLIVTPRPRLRGDVSVPYKRGNMRAQNQFQDSNHRVCVSVFLVLEGTLFWRCDFWGPSAGLSELGSIWEFKI